MQWFFTKDQQAVVFPSGGGEGRVKFLELMVVTRICQKFKIVTLVYDNSEKSYSSHTMKWIPMSCHRIQYIQNHTQIFLHLITKSKFYMFHMCSLTPWPQVSWHLFSWLEFLSLFPHPSSFPLIAIHNYIFPYIAIIFFLFWGCHLIFS